MAIAFLFPSYSQLLPLLAIAGKFKVYSIYVPIGGKNIYPTTPQALMCVIICQYLSNFYQEIQLFRFSDTTGNVFILASDELQILIFHDGTWRFVNET